MKNRINSLLFAFTCLLVSACDYDIDDKPLDFIDISVVVSDSLYTCEFVNNFYASIPHGYNRLDGNSMLASASDEAVESGRNSEAEAIALGRWTSSTLRDNTWTEMYSGIRNTNTFLYKIYPAIPEGLFKSMTSIERLVGEAYFFRAYFHFELLKRYGGIPLVDNVLSVEESREVPRSTFDDCVNFILDDLEKAEILPAKWERGSDYGRATKGAVLALKSRLLLYAASPLFNDQSKPENTEERGAYDVDKWKAAADASYSVISLNQYCLNYQNSDWYKVFTTIGYDNKEIIFQRMDQRNNDVERLNGPTGFTGGEGGTCPTLDLVDAYRMADGTNFDWKNPSHANNPFENREERFNQSILKNGDFWMGRYLEIYEGGADASSDKATRTGFYLKKLLNPDARWFGGTQSPAYHCFPHFRYAEILLNYAEAMNEAYGPDEVHTYSKSARNAINDVRIRGGLTPLPYPISQSDLREEIIRERRIELAFEEHRHMDLRRWKMAESVLNTPVRGLKIIPDDNNNYTYQPQDNIQNRAFKTYMYLYPIPQSEISRSNVLTQNTGW